MTSCRTCVASGMPPPVAHRPGMPHMAPGPPSTAPGMMNRPAVPTATATPAQPPVTKPLFPSAGQVQYSGLSLSH